MHRLALLAIVVGCGRADPPPPAPPPVAYPAPPLAWGLGRTVGILGRSDAPQEVTQLAIAGPGQPLHLPTPWAVPGDRALAAIYGREGEAQAVELIEIDAGRVLWRVREACAGPIVGVTAKAIVCADVRGTRAVAVADGKALWKSEAAFIAMTDDRVVVAAPGEAVILDAGAGDELARVKLPAGVIASNVLASCGDAGRELFALANDRLVRIAEAAGGPKVRWSAAVGEVLSIDACDGPVLVALADRSLVAFEHERGAQTGRLAGVRGSWPSGDRVAVATATGVASYTRDLTGAIQTTLPVLGELIAKRGGRRLVRASDHTAVLLEGMLPVAYLPFAALGGVLGDRAVIAATWSGSPRETVHRFALPPQRKRALRIVATPGVALPAELRDLPAPAAAPIATLETSLASAAQLALDPEQPSALYVAGPEGQLARADLPKAWAWQRGGCGKEPTAIAVGRDEVACASQGGLAVAGKDGTARWTLGSGADALAASGHTLIAFAADRATVYDLRTGTVLRRFASDDGAPARAAVIARGAVDWLLSVERGRLVARAGGLPVWNLAVAGTIASLQPSGEGVVVTLDDGDAYRVELATARVLPLPGFGLAWTAFADVLVGTTVGGPLPAPLPPPPPAPRHVGPLPKPDPEAAPMSVPLPMPAKLGDSFQVGLYEPRGGLRVRNDYALGGSLAQRAPGAPLAIVAGRELLVVETHRGDPIARIPLPERAGPAFTTIVDGKPVTGVLLADPLGFQLY